MNPVESATGSSNLPEGNGKEEEELGRRITGMMSGMADESTARDAKASANGGEDVGLERGGARGGYLIPPPPRSPGGVDRVVDPDSGGEHMGKVMSVGAPAGSWDPPPPGSLLMSRGEEERDGPDFPKHDTHHTHQEKALSDASKDYDRSYGSDERTDSREREGRVEEKIATEDTVSAEEAPRPAIASEQEEAEAGSDVLTSTPATLGGSRRLPEGNPGGSTAEEEGVELADKKTVGSADTEIVESSADRELKEEATAVEKEKEKKEIEESSGREVETSAVTSLGGEEEEGGLRYARVERKAAAAASGGEEEKKPSDRRSTEVVERGVKEEEVAGKDKLEEQQGESDIETTKEGGTENSIRSVVVERIPAKEEVVASEDKLKGQPEDADVQTAKMSGKEEKIASEESINQSEVVDDDADRRRSAAVAGEVGDRALTPPPQEEETPHQRSLPEEEEEEDELSSTDEKAREALLGVAGDPSLIARDRVTAGVTGGVNKAARFAPLIVVFLAAVTASLWSLFITKPTNLPPFSLISSDPASNLITAARVQLPDGRHVAYREWGARWEDAKHTIVVVHGMVSSRRAGMPGVNPDLLKEFDVRLISYDRPGFGQSDPDPSRTMKSGAKDMAEFAKLVNVTGRFWVLGYSGGGPHALAAARFIPDNIEGVVLWAPLGNPYSPDLTAEEARIVWSQAPVKLEFMLARRAPWILTTYMERGFLPRLWQGIADMGMQVGKKDREFLKWHGLKTLQEDVRESLRQGRGNHIAEELRLYVSDWGFKLNELNRNLTGTGDHVHDRFPEGGEGVIALHADINLSAAPGYRSPGGPSLKTERIEESSVEENEGGEGGGEKNANASGDSSVRSSEDHDGEKSEVGKRESQSPQASQQQQPSLRSPSDLPLHVWHGTDDLLVPSAFSLHLKRVIPRLHLHLLQGHGHFSWFCHCDGCHREFLDTLFGKDTFAAAATVEGSDSDSGGKLTPSPAGKKTMTIADGGHGGVDDERRQAGSSSPNAPGEESPVVQESSLPGTTVPIA